MALDRQSFLSGTATIGGSVPVSGGLTGGGPVADSPARPVVDGPLTLLDNIAQNGTGEYFPESTTVQNAPVGDQPANLSGTGSGGGTGSVFVGNGSAGYLPTNSAAAADDTDTGLGKLAAAAVVLFVGLVLYRLGR